MTDAAYQGAGRKQVPAQRHEHNLKANLNVELGRDYDPRGRSEFSQVCAGNLVGSGLHVSDGADVTQNENLKGCDRFYDENNRMMKPMDRLGPWFRAATDGGGRQVAPRDLPAHGRANIKSTEFGFMGDEPAKRYDDEQVAKIADMVLQKNPAAKYYASAY